MESASSPTSVSAREEISRLRAVEEEAFRKDWEVKAEDAVQRVSMGGLAVIVSVFVGRVMRGSSVKSQCARRRAKMEVDA